MYVVVRYADKLDPVSVISSPPGTLVLTRFHSFQHHQGTFAVDSMTPKKRHVRRFVRRDANVLPLSH